METVFFSHLINLHYLAPRFWENEIRAADYIKNVLHTLNINYISQKYKVTYPYWKSYYLKADDKFLEVLPCGFGSGKFINKFNLVDSSDLDVVYDDFVISYNSKCNFVSTPVMYPNVGLAIKKSDVNILNKAKYIEGYLEVVPYNFVSENIIVGNLKNPEKVLICHYDSFWGGSLDNGTGSALLLTLVNKLDLNKYLILFAGSEEISLDDYERYWCFGYRKFEEKYYDILKQTKQIIIFDSFGYKENEIVTDKNILKEAFLINDISLLDKTQMYCSKFEYILENYHTPADIPDKIDNVNFNEILDIIKG